MTDAELDDIETRWRSYTRLGPWWSDMRRLIQEVRLLRRKNFELAGVKDGATRMLNTKRTG